MGSRIMAEIKVDVKALIWAVIVLGSAVVSMATYIFTSHVGHNEKEHEEYDDIIDSLVDFH
jgi:hypothetical protein